MELTTAARSSSTLKGITIVEGRGGSRAAGHPGRGGSVVPTHPAVNYRNCPGCALLKAAEWWHH